jgi:hypothetical protein
MSKSGATNPRPNAHKGFYPNRLLASSGPYRDYISLVSALVPKVAVADPRNPASPLENRHANVTMLNLKENTKPYCREFSDTSSLQEHLDRRLRAAKPTPAGTPERRIYILEGLNADYIAILGGFFYMDPLFFVDQEQTSIWDKSHFGARMTECLPSVAESMSSFRLPYFEIMYFNKLIEHYQMHCKSTGRHIGITRMSGKFEKEVIVRRKCSFWSQENDDSGWDGKELLLEFLT